MKDNKLHYTMIYISCGLVFLSLMGHLYRPEDKFWDQLTWTALGVLFGKFTNGFGGFRNERFGEDASPSRHRTGVDGKHSRPQGRREGDGQD